MGVGGNSLNRRHNDAVESILPEREFRLDTLGRAVPVAWRVIEHKSSSVSFDVYEQLLRRTSRLLPTGARVRFIADRGFADTKLMHYLKQNLGWHESIRVKNDMWVLQPGKTPCQLNKGHLNLGEVMLLQGVKITKLNLYGLVNLALARDPISRELWYIVSDETTSLQTFREYGERFDIEEEFLDEKSNGFQLEKSLIRSPMALSRLCLVMAIATLFLTVPGLEVVKTGKRRLVDCHNDEVTAICVLVGSGLRVCCIADGGYFPLFPFPEMLTKSLL